jgi:hypothetical protein
MSQENIESCGIQNVEAEDGGLVARLAAPDPQKARVRVLASLEGGDFEVGQPSDESEGKPGRSDAYAPPIP